MPVNPRLDRVVSFCSWMIVVALIYGAVSLFIIPPVHSGPVTNLIGPLGTEVFYASLYLLEAGLLAYSKLFKKKKLRKRVLMSIYTTGIFTTILTVALLGWISPRVVDNAIISVSSAICWLYWKFKTEYIDPSYFYNKTTELRDDIPPNALGDTREHD